MSLRYNTGKPCKRGHRSDRYPNGACIECAQLRRANSLPKHADRYMTGKPCVRGHLSERYPNGACIECTMSHHNKHPLEKTLWMSARQRAQRDNLPFDITIDDIVVPEVCPVLGIPIIRGIGKCSQNSPSLDKIEPHLGYVRGNIIVMSHRANTIKSNASVDELRQVADWLFHASGLRA